ncbi:MAG: hypothetical protein ACXACG_13505 [Candidatus Thorarchaeota archaeon]|jgi:hypothetical protein
MQDVEVLKLLSVTLTRDKQILLEEELQKYGAATNWTIKQILKQRLSSRAKTFEALQDDFVNKYDKRRRYLEDVVKTASVEITQHHKLAETVRSMRDRTPYFKPGRLIFSQPIVRLDEKAVTLTLTDGSLLPIPFDKRSRNRLAEKIAAIIRGSKEGGVNKNYDRIRITWNKEGFADIDIRALKLESVDT